MTFLRRGVESADGEVTPPSSRPERGRERRHPLGRRLAPGGPPRRPWGVGEDEGPDPPRGLPGCGAPALRVARPSSPARKSWALAAHAGDAERHGT